MSMSKVKLGPLQITRQQERDVRTQFGAICYRVRKDKVQVLLVTSRGTGRWIIPKGWPIAGATPADAALREAWEEAGVDGKVKGGAVGLYSYFKRDDGTRLPCVVAVFAVKVRSLMADFPERKSRKRRWFSLKRAAEVVDEPELTQILRHFDPRGLA